MRRRGTIAAAAQVVGLPFVEKATLGAEHGAGRRHYAWSQGGPGLGAVPAVVFLMALTVSACANRTYREDATPPVAEPRMVYQTHVAMGPCVFKRELEPEAIPLLAPIAAALLSSAVSTGSTTLAKRFRNRPR